MKHLVHFQREIRRYRYARPVQGKDVNERQGPVKKSDHLMDLMRYQALMKLPYVPPSRRPGWGQGDCSGMFGKVEKRREKRDAAARAASMNCL
jgi:hypothetical protein